MHFKPTGIEGAWLIEPEPFRDDRGAFARTFCADTFAARGLETHFVQHSLSSSLAKGTFRGMHLQAAPFSEVKLVSCVRGAILDVIADLRPQSASYLAWAGFELSAANGHQLYIPKGVAHGHLTLTDDAAVNYLISERYVPDAARGVRYDDPALGIVLPMAPSVISDRDRGWPPIR